MSKTSYLSKFTSINRRFLVFFAIIPLIYFPCYVSDELVRQLAREDGIYENLGAIFFLFTAIVFLPCFCSQVILYSKGNRKRERMFFILLGLLFFFAFGEEISWGQRIFNFATPDSIKEINRQQEFNLHNIGIFHGRTLEGDEKKGILKLFTMHRLFYMSFLTYLFVIPLIYGLSIRFKTFIDKINLPIPSIIFWFVFCFNWAFGNILRAVKPNIDGHGIVEIKETVFALILFMLALSWVQFKNFRKIKK